MSHLLINPTTRNPRRHSGFTLIEVLVTVVVVSIGLLGLAGLQINGLRANMSSEARSKATLMASDIIERMRANPVGVADNAYDGIDTANIGCGGQPNPFCSNTNSAAATNCNTTQMATFDAWVWACGMPPANGNVQPGGITNQLSQGTGSVDCNDVDTTDADPCTAGSTYSVTVTWNELNPNSTDVATSGVDTVQTLALTIAP
jgi:type IV pilus assembly protein PilV